MLSFRPLKFCALLLLLLLGNIFPTLAAAESERITNFHSDIVINADRSMVVTETIRVYANGSQIRRGIYREFPTQYKDRNGRSYKVGFELLAVLRDGQQESYHSERMSNGIKYYFGKEDVFLSPGYYTYTFKYWTNRQLGFFANHDELYWNVTGNGWKFVIEEANATVHFPFQLARDRFQLFGYTGKSGSKDSNLEAQVLSPNSVEFRSKAVLLPEEGLTIVASFPKGLIPEPTSAEKFRYIVTDNLNSIFAFGILVFIFLHYYKVWKEVGKDPDKGLIIPLFSPPDNLSPAAVRYISKMGFDKKCVAASLVNLAVNGRLKIEEEGSKFRLQRTSKDTAAKSNISEPEKVLETMLLSGSGSLLLSNESHSKIGKALTTFENSLKGAFDKKMFNLNRNKTVFPILISLGAIVGGAFLDRMEVGLGVLFITIWLSVWTVGVYALVTKAIDNWRLFLGSKGVINLFGAIFITVFSIPFVAGEFFAFFALSSISTPIFGTIAVLLVLVNVVFFNLLSAPTELGRKVMDQIEGFKLYLNVGEKEVLKVKDAPEPTVELYEKYLPYAMALDVEDNWSGKFSAILAAAAIANQAYSPVWYSGHSLSNLSSGGLSSFSNSFGSAVSSSSTAPGSSSGGGGGGSSGGGGGGGGGGGW